MEQEQTTIRLLTELKKQDDRISQLEKTVEQIIAVLNGERIKANFSTSLNCAEVQE